MAIVAVVMIVGFSAFKVVEEKRTEKLTNVWYMFIGDDKDLPGGDYYNQINDPAFYVNTNSNASPSCTDDYQICGIFLPDSGQDHPDLLDFQSLQNDLENEVTNNSSIVLKE